MISRKEKFLGASPDNIRTCQCSKGCPNIVVEYKCPWKHRELHPKQAFLTKEIGGAQSNGTFYLTPNSKYYYQIQTLMFVAELSLCDYIVWTIQGIFSLQVCYDAKFMESVCKKLKLFWMTHVLPCIMKRHQQMYNHIYMVCKLNIYFQFDVSHKLCFELVSLGLKYTEFSFSFTWSLAMEEAKVNILPDDENKDVEQPSKYI